MTLVEHLRELRTRVFKALIFILLGAVVGFFWYDHGLLEFLKDPYCDLPYRLRFGATAASKCNLLVFDIAGGLILRLKIAFLAGVLLSAPFWLYQLWAFITPGLKKNERRYAITFVALSSLLFAAGTICAYFTLRAGLKVLLTLAGSDVVSALAAPDYLDFVVSLMVVFGVSFEVPLLLVMLNIVGIVKYSALKKSRRWLIFLTFVFAAFITPTTDPFSMLAMAIPMALLFEGSIQFARVHDKRQAKRELVNSFDHISDDEASPLDTGPSAIEPPPTDTDNTDSGT